MSDEKDSPSADPAGDDAYVIEDTGESLSDFNLSEEEGSPDSEQDSAELQKVREENQKLRDQLLRARADFENFRRRAEREKADFFKFALTESMRDLLPVLDNFERAMRVTPGDGVDEFVKGIDLIYKQFQDVLARFGLKAVEQAPVPFDPAIHEAVTREENTGFPSHTVVEVLQKGYFLNDRLIRPALVRVAVGGAEENASADGQSSASS
ncbi:MAG TPA: nucleotide exchange factor GrpE [Thermoanaerobaculia bacterium]|nr:nucleotide exchange factor GrpE [Thermoanaerobaculia bacterium]